jgi:spoIIIJ-associated protein
MEARVSEILENILSLLNLEGSFDIAERAKSWVEEVKESKESMALDPMPAWQRRIVHMVVQESAGVKSESVGEGIERHLVISPE